jgi:hypothetical protein
MGTWRHLEAKVGTSKGRGKQWQTTPNKVPRMQRARAIPVACLGSGSCQNRPKLLNTNDYDDIEYKGMHVMRKKIRTLHLNVTTIYV